jgi:Tol biopolymer transport system component
MTQWTRATAVKSILPGVWYRVFFGCQVPKRLEFTTHEQSGAQMSFLAEVKRRKVFQVAAMYAVVAWLLIQVITSVETPLNLPDWVDTFVITLLIVGFPIALVFAWAFDVTPQGIKPADEVEPVGEVQRSLVTTFSLGMQGVVLLAVGFLVVNQFFQRPGSQGPGVPTVTEVIRYNYGLADEEKLVPTYGVSLAVSPDGARVVYVGPGETGRQLWIRDRDKLSGVPLPETDGAVQPFFSPDGRGIGFITEDHSLKIISKIGDSPLTIDNDDQIVAGASWGSDGYIYYSMDAGLVRRPATGGGFEEQITFAESTDMYSIYHEWPDVLPNGKGAVFTISKDHLPNQIAVVDFSTSQISVLAEGVLGRFAQSGHLIYVREDGGLMAAQFSLDRLMLKGQEVLLDDQLPAGNVPDLAISRSGRLLYHFKPRPTLEVVWVERNGAWTSIDQENPILGIRYAVLSPDDTSLALTTYLRPPSDDGQIWTKNLPHGPLAQLTFEGAVNMRPSWSPDGQSVVFISDRGENRDVWIKPADGTKRAEVVLDHQEVIDEAFYSSSGEWLVYRRGKVDSGRDIYAVRSDPGAEAVPLLTSGFDEVAPALSADERWLAYVSDRDGQANVYVRPFPGAESETQVSVNGGTGPVWARSRPELFYRNGAGQMVAMQVLPGEKFRAGPEQVLFSAVPYRQDFYHAAYDATTDGQRFVMIRISDSGLLEEELVAVENWFEELKRLVPTD